MGCTSSTAKSPIKVPVSVNQPQVGSVPEHLPESSVQHLSKPSIPAAIRAEPRVPVPAPPLPQSPPSIAVRTPPLRPESSSKASPGTVVTLAPSVPTRFDPNIRPDIAVTPNWPFLERRIQTFDSNKAITLIIGDFEGTFSLSTTLNLDKSTESLYATVNHELHHDQFALIHQGKVLPADTTPVGAYGVHESGRIDCLFLSLRA